MIIRKKSCLLINSFLYNVIVILLLNLNFTVDRQLTTTRLIVYTNHHFCVKPEHYESIMVMITNKHKHIISKIIKSQTKNGIHPTVDRYSQHYPANRIGTVTCGIRKHVFPGRVVRGPFAPGDCRGTAPATNLSPRPQIEIYKC